jgi:hypothetical protein
MGKMLVARGKSQQGQTITKSKVAKGTPRHPRIQSGFGSSCRIFQRIAIALNWIAREKLHIRRSIQYMDDTFIAEPTDELCCEKMALFQRMCSDIDFKIAHEKTEGPAECLKFLGIELDIRTRTAQLSKEKLEKCTVLIDSILQTDHTTLEKLQEIIGTLNFACSVVLHGR